MNIRLNKFLSQQGIASRRKADALVDEGRVVVNGKKAVLGERVDPALDVVTVDGEVVRVGKEKYIYIMVHKPKGVVSTVRDELGRETVLDLVINQRSEIRKGKSEGILHLGTTALPTYAEASAGKRDYGTSKEFLISNQTSLNPVGRLDMDSRGLVLLTNDGQLIYELTQARFEVEKEYEVMVAGELEEWKLRKLRGGVALSDGVTAECEVEIVGNGKSRMENEILDIDDEVKEERITNKLSSQQHMRRHLLRFVLKEGRNRQIRRMCGALQLEVMDLKRVRIGGLELGNLDEGAWREVAREEIVEGGSEKGKVNIIH